MLAFIIKVGNCQCRVVLWNSCAVWEGPLLPLFSVAALPEHFSGGRGRRGMVFGSLSLASPAGVTLQTGFLDQPSAGPIQARVVIFRLECAQG